MDFDNRSRPPTFCGAGPMDPFLRQDINSMSATRFSTGRLVASYENGEITIAGSSRISLFGYGAEDRLPSETGYDSSFIADETMTNCTRGGGMAPKGCMFVAVGMAARIGVPYLCESGAERYPSWLDEACEKKIHRALAESSSIDLRFGTTGLSALYRLGSLITHGAVFDYATGEGFEDAPTPTPCGKILRHLDRTFATCALERDHAETWHRHGLLLWTDEDAEKLEDGAEQPFEGPKAFSPFSIASVLGRTDEHETVNIQTGNSAMVFDPGTPRSTIPGRIAIPIRVWLFGQVMIAPQPLWCGVPSSDTEIAAVHRAVVDTALASPDPTGEGLWPLPLQDDEG